MQRQTVDGWETVHRYVATLVVRVNDLPSGGSYRAVVPDSEHFVGTVTSTVRL